MTGDTDYRTLPARYYIDPDHFKKEREHFFGQKWVCAGRADRIPEPGDYFTREIAGESLLFTRGADGRVRALYNVCRHRGTRICESDRGNFKGRIQCPYHGWTYTLEGKLAGAPHMAGTKGFAPDDYPLHEAACSVWEGHVFVNLSPDPKPLAEHIGPLDELFRPWRMGDLVVGKHTVYEVKANWKLIIQNYSECLHCPFIHPALSKLSPYLSGDNQPGDPRFLGGRMSLKDGVDTMTFSGKTTRDTLPGLGPEELRYVYYYALLPNLLLSPHPDFVMTHLLWPKSESLTEIHCEFLFHPEQMKRPGFTMDDAMEFWDVTNRQDWHVSELSQLGLTSRRYTPGPYSHREGLLHDLDKIVLETFPLSEREREAT